MNAYTTNEKVFPPKYLYRYYSNPEYIIDVLANRHVYHSHPGEFNDPFDCKPFIALRYSRCKQRDVWQKAFYYLGKSQNEAIPETEHQRSANEAVEKGAHNNLSFLEKLERHINDLGDLLNVACFSESPRNPMLWAHYADSYKGAVFQFRSSGLWDEASRTFRGFRVIYREEPLGIESYVQAMEDHFENNNPLTFAKMFYCSKSKHWKQEEEVRFFSIQKQKHVEFNERSLQSIILGSDCSEILESRIRSSIATWTHKPQLFKTSTSKSGVKLYIEHC